MPPTELVVDLVLKLLLPAILPGAAVMGLAIWLLDRKWWESAATVAVAVGLLVGNSLRPPLNYLPEGWGWGSLFSISLGALLVTAVTRGVPKFAVGLALRCLLLAILSTCLLEGTLRTWPWFIGLALVVIGNVVALELLATRQPGVILPLAWTTLLVGGAVAVLISSHSARFADITMLLCAAQFGVLLAGWKLPSIGSVLAPLMALTIPGLMVAGFDSTFSSVPVEAFVLVAVAPLAVTTTLLPAPWRQAAIFFLCVALAVAMAIRAEGLPSI